MRDTSISACVYIWYPVDDNVGHASMYIGDPRTDRTDETHATNYVSWWPKRICGFFERVDVARNSRLRYDIQAEQENPHVRYVLYGLDVWAMRNEWQVIRLNPAPHYQILRKNCSTVVLRVLKAGGALERLSLAKRVWFSNNLYVTPKNVAQVCNELRNRGLSEKKKGANCPEKALLDLGFR